MNEEMDCIEEKLSEIFETLPEKYQNQVALFLTAIKLKTWRLGQIINEIKKENELYRVSVAAENDRLDRNAALEKENESLKNELINYEAIGKTLQSENLGLLQKIREKDAEISKLKNDNQKKADKIKTNFQEKCLNEFSTSNFYDDPDLEER